MIGNLRARLTLQEPVRMPDTGGGFVTTFESVAANATVYAEIRQLSGAEQFRYSQLERNDLFRVILRWRGDVTTDMRLAGDGYLYSILSSCDRDGKKDWLEITALRQPA